MPLPFNEYLPEETLRVCAFTSRISLCVFRLRRAAAGWMSVRQLVAPRSLAELILITPRR